MGGEEIIVDGAVVQRKQVIRGPNWKTFEN